jgi:hypothetical protein
VTIFSASREQIRAAYEQARREDVQFSLYTEELFATGNDIDNRAAVKAVSSEALNLVGMALRGRKKPMDRITKGLRLHP